MRYNKYNKLLWLGLATLLLSSCSISQRSIREPHAIVKYDKAEFDYSEQVIGEASSTLILGVDWGRLFNNQTGKTSKAFGSYVYGNVPTTKAESYALYDIMSKNPGFDFIVYPQYTVETKAPGMGLFFKQINITAKARLAVANDQYVQEGEGGLVVGNSKDLEESLANLQSSYDDLVVEMSGVKEKCTQQEQVLRQQIKAAKEEALVAQKAAYNAQVSVSSEPQTSSPITTTPTTTTPAVAAKPANTTATADLPPASSAQMPQTTTSVAGTYMLVIGSYSTPANAQKAIAQFNAKYPTMKGQVGMVISGVKYRVGFLNFKDRNDVVNFKTNLVNKNPEFKDAWPFRP